MTEDAPAVLGRLRHKLTQWEKNLKANIEHYEKDSSVQSALNAKTQLSVITDIWEEIGRVPAPEGTFWTADRHPIHDGMLCWNNDLKVVRIDFNTTFGRSPEVMKHWDGWFDTLNAKGEYGGMFNGERLAVFHPTTKEKARFKA